MAEPPVIVEHLIMGATHGKKRQPVREREQRQEREPEVRHRDEEERDATEHVISRRAAPCDLREGDEDSERKAADERYDHEKERIRKRGREHFAHRALVRERPP